MSEPCDIEIEHYQSINGFGMTVQIADVSVEALPSDVTIGPALQHRGEWVTPVTVTLLARKVSGRPKPALPDTEWAAGFLAPPRFEPGPGRDGGPFGSCGSCGAHALLTAHNLCKRCTGEIRAVS